MTDITTLINLRTMLSEQIKETHAKYYQCTIYGEELLSLYERYASVRCEINKKRKEMCRHVQPYSTVVAESPKPIKTPHN